MSLSDFVPVEDTPVTIGVVQFRGGKKLPIYIVEFPAYMPSFRHHAPRYSRINLDIVPSEGGFTFYVTSNLVITELTSEKLERALAGDPDNIKSALLSQGVPEFSSSSETTSDAHDAFAEAQSESGGQWMLVVLMEDATELLIGPDTRVVRMSRRERMVYTQD